MDGFHETGERQIFEYFFIVKLELDGTFSRRHTFPKHACTEKILLQCEKFCFPFSKSDLNVMGQKHQHFTFVLTDLDRNRKYGFCKLTDNGKQCYCFLGTFAWFEIFYKCLNCVYIVHSRKDLITLHSIVETLYKLPVPKPNDVVNVSASLTFSVPSDSSLPSIPENRNLMEYISTINVKNMMEIFAALMFERRVIFTSTNLSVLTGCIFAAENLLYPLSWQHIFIPILHEHITDYCAAPMPFIVGIHDSLFSIIKNTAVTDGVVVVHLDSNTVETPFDDLENMPSEAVSFFRGQLGKRNIAVGTHLAEAFLKTQARIFGDYRSALKFRMGQSIEFDEEKFIELHKPGSRRSFAEELVQLQTFAEFIDRRLHMLNNGIGFHDAFENEVSGLKDQSDFSGVYKEWLSVTRKGSELITSMRKQAKSNMKHARASAKQGMRDMKNAMKPMPRETTSTSLRREQSLRENITKARPPRPPPIRPPPIRFADRPAKKVTRFKTLDEDDENACSYPDHALGLHPSSQSTKLPEIKEDGLLIDLSSDPEPLYQPELFTHKQEVKYANLLCSMQQNLSGLEIKQERSQPLVCEKCNQSELLCGVCPHATAKSFSNDLDDLFSTPNSVINNLNSAGQSASGRVPLPQPRKKIDHDQPLISFD